MHEWTKSRKDKERRQGLRWAEGRAKLVGTSLHATHAQDSTHAVELKLATEISKSGMLDLMADLLAKPIIHTTSCISWKEMLVIVDDGPYMASLSN